MSDYKILEAERMDEENAMYSDWVDSNEDYIIETYINSSQFEFPLEIYDDYVANMTIDDVPEDFIRRLYNEQE